MKTTFCCTKMSSVLIVVLFACTICCKSQVGVKGDPDSLRVQKLLVEYQIDTCLRDLLHAVVEADSGHLKFPPEVFYYDLTFTIGEGTREMMISPDRWSRSKAVDFSAAIKIKDMFFLCRGDFGKDILFKKTQRTVPVSLKRPRPYYYDSIDVRLETYLWKPSLSGRFIFCKGVPISLNIFVGKGLEGYATKKPD